MKLFDLEAAKRGEPIQHKDGRQAKFASVSPCNTYLAVWIQDPARYPRWLIEIYRIDGTDGNFRLSCDLVMAPKKRTVWVNVAASAEDRYYKSNGRICVG